MENRSKSNDYDSLSLAYKTEHWYSSSLIWDSDTSKLKVSIK